MTAARSYKTFALTGLIAAVWFAALAKGGHDLWAATTLFAWLSLIAFLFLAGVYKTNNRVAFPLAGCFSLILFGFLISSRFSFDMDTSRLEMWIWFFCSLAFFLFINLFRDSALRIKFIRIGGLIILPVTLVAAGQYRRDLPTFIHSHWAAASTFTNSAVLAGFALSWALNFWHLRDKSPIYRWLFIVSMLTLLLARSWWAAISLSLGLMYYYKENIKSNLKSMQLKFIAFCFSAVGFLILTYIYKLGSWQKPIYRATDRFSWWGEGLRMAQEHPWVGIGLGSYGAAFPFFKTSAILNTLYAHSFPVQILSETGLLGCFGVFLLAIQYTRMASARHAQSKELDAYQATVFTLFCFSLTSIFLDYFVGKLMLLMNMALVLSLLDLKTVLISRRTISGLAVGLILIVPSWYLPLRASQYYVEGLQYENQSNERMAEFAYKKSLALNPYQDESCAALAHLFEHRYRRSHSLLDLSTSLFWARRALSLKKTSTSVL